MIADKRGIGDFDERIVDLEEKDRLDAALLHIGERAGALERREKSAVTVGTHEDMTGLIENDLALGAHTGPHTLGEEKHIVGIKTEIIVLFEALDRRGVVGLARHHVERNGSAVADRTRENLAGVEIEERRVRYGADLVAALRPVVPETRTLTARDEKRGYAALGKFNFTGGAGLGEFLTLKDRDFRSLALGAVGNFGALAESLPATRDALGIDRRDLLEKRFTLLPVKLLPMFKNMFLRTFSEKFFSLLIIHTDSFRFLKLYR